MVLHLARAKRTWRPMAARGIAAFRPPVLLERSGHWLAVRWSDALGGPRLEPGPAGGSRFFGGHPARFMLWHRGSHSGRPDAWKRRPLPAGNPAPTCRLWIARPTSNCQQRLERSSRTPRRAQAHGPGGPLELALPEHGTGLMAQKPDQRAAWIGLAPAQQGCSARVGEAWRNSKLSRPPAWQLAPLPGARPKPWQPACFCGQSEGRTNLATMRNPAEAPLIEERSTKGFRQSGSRGPDHPSRGSRFSPRLRRADLLRMWIAAC